MIHTDIGQECAWGILGGKLGKRKLADFQYNS